MARPKTHSERMIILERIIGLVKEQGRITTNDVVAIFGVHRTTAEKYLRIALERGGFIRHGRCGIFRDQRAVIDYDLRRYSSSQVTGFSALPVLAGMMSDFGSIRSLLPADGKIDGAKFDALKPVFETLLPRIADELSSLTEDDTNAIIHPCLAVVSRKHMGGWTPVFNSGQLVFDDIDLLTMLQLVARVVADSLGNFLPVSLTSETPDQTQG